MVQDQKLPEVIFREYDIRGKVGQDLRIDQVYDLGCAIAYFFKQKKPEVKTIAVAMDGRVHSPAIKKELTTAFLDSGLDVRYIGLCHSPGLYFAMHNLDVQAGAMITASHNPKEYNGLKLCLDTESIWGVDIQELYRTYKAGSKLQPEHKGNYVEEPILPAYINWLEEHFEHLKGMDIAAVIDCANGAAGTVIPELVKRMQWPNVTVLYPEVDGTYPHHEANPVDIENMQDVKKVLDTTDAQIGIGLDGDADRMAPMTKSGVLVPGDLLLGIYAQQVIKKHPELAVAFDVKGSGALVDYLKQIGATPCMSATGHSIVKKTMKEQKALLAGELSCHFFFKDRYFGYDDGVYALLRLFEILQETHQTLDELLKVYPALHTSREYRIPVPEEQKKHIVQTVTDAFTQKEDTHVLTIDGVRATMPYGWGLLRASNTQPALSIRFEAYTAEHLAQVKEDFKLVLKSFYDTDFLTTAFQ